MNKKPCYIQPGMATTDVRVSGLKYYNFDLCKEKKKESRKF